MKHHMPNTIKRLEDFANDKYSREWINVPQDIKNLIEAFKMIFDEDIAISEMRIKLEKLDAGEI